MTPPELPQRFVVVCEDRLHWDVAVRWTDRRIEDRISWANGILDSLRIWHERTRHRAWYKLGDRPRAGRFDVRVHGQFRGEQAAPEAQSVRKVLVLIQGEVSPAPAAVVMLRDTDGEDRSLGHEQARDSGRWPFAVVLAFPDPEVEAWLVACAATLPATAGRRAALRDRLGFDATSQPERLTSKNLSDPKDAKRAWREICGGGDLSGEAVEVGFDALAHVSSIQAFVADVDARLVPLLAGYNPNARTRRKPTAPRTRH